MLCEGSPLLFYTPWGPVTPMGMYRGARRLSQSRRADQGADWGADRGAKRSIAPVLDYLAQSMAPCLDNLAQSLAPGLDNLCWQRSRPGRDPGLAIDRLLLLYILFPDALRG